MWSGDTSDLSNKYGLVAINMWLLLTVKALMGSLLEVGGPLLLFFSSVAFH